MRGLLARKLERAGRQAAPSRFQHASAETQLAHDPLGAVLLNCGGLFGVI